jgi:hypothetical protein
MLKRVEVPNQDQISLAASFITRAQLAQQEHGKKFVGKTILDDHICARITSFISSDAQVISYSTKIPEFPQALETLLSRFEGLCQRRGLPSPRSPFDTQVYSELSKKLHDNIEFFQCPATLAISPTLLSPTALIEAFSTEPLSDYYKNLPGTVRRSFAKNPANPVKFMLDCHSRLQEIDSYLATIKETLPDSSKLRIAMASHQKKVIELVDSHFALIKSISQEREFRDIYRNEPSVVKHAVNNYGEKGARDFLRLIHKTYANILADDGFKILRSRPKTILIAAIHHPHNTEQFLEAMLEREKNIRKLADRVGEVIGNKEIRTLCLKTPLRARELESSLRLRAADLPN